jgi:hypothetical protein
LVKAKIGICILNVNVQWVGFAFATRLYDDDYDVIGMIFQIYCKYFIIHGKEFPNWMKHGRLAPSLHLLHG